MAHLTPRAKEVLIAAGIGAGLGALLYFSQHPAPPPRAAPYLRHSRRSGGGAEDEAGQQPGQPVTLPPAWELAPYPQ